MVFRRAVRRELTQTAAAIFVALFAILLTTQLIRLLSQAAAGRLAPEAVVALLGFAALNYLSVLLSITLFITVLLTLSRAYRDSEMVVWFSSGLPLTAWIRPVMTFALPIILAIGALSLLLSPWALEMSQDYRQKLSERSDASAISPGSFKEAPSRNLVVFVEGMAEDETTLRNIFASTVNNGRLGIIMAAEGSQEIADNGDRFLVMRDGHRYEVVPESPEMTVLEFVRYLIRIETKEDAGEVDNRNISSTSTPELIQRGDRFAQAELIKRTGIPISAAILVLLAIPLSFVNPRAGRSANLILAIFVYLIYSNLLSVNESWVSQGRISPALGWWIIHALVGAALPLMFARRIMLTSFFRRKS